MAATDIVFRRGRFFTAGDVPWAESVVVSGDRLAAVGGDGEVAAAYGPDTEVVDLGGRFALPGVTDAHFHTLMAGDALRRADLVHARDLAGIAPLVRGWADEHPASPWVLGRGWLHSSIPNGAPTRQMLDQVVADRPVFLDANDLHSGWVNTAGLAQLGIGAGTPDPPGGEIVRDGDGAPTGELKETAVALAWEHFASITTDAERDERLRAVLGALAAAGVTSVVDMALTPPDLAAMARAERADGLTARIRAHVLMAPDRDPAPQIEEAAALAARHASPWLSVVGIKIVSDGVIDACTAAMLWPFANGSHPPAIWEPDLLRPTVVAADAAGLQVAIHAIGDRAIRNALDAFEEAAGANGPTDLRHRIEHIELPDPEDIPRFGELNVTASMQPVHADPAIRDNWTAMLGDERSTRGFPWTAIGASTRLVLGTDAPTAPLEALHNLFIASTRRSALDRSIPAPPGEPTIPLDAALRGATIDAAWSCRDERERGSLDPGKLADFVVLDADPFDAGPESLLDATVVRTVVGGRTVFEA